MQEPRLSRLFVRFRERRDGRALAAVFDGTAPELLSVARHLVRSPDEADAVRVDLGDPTPIVHQFSVVSGTEVQETVVHRP